MDNIFYQIVALHNNDSLELKELISHNDFITNMPELLKKYKAIKLTPIKNGNLLNNNFTENDFAQNLLDCKLTKFNYIGGAAPRKNIPVSQKENIIFTANEAPADQVIPFHHELAQSANPPDYVSFYCKKQPVKDGETPLIDSLLVYQYLHKKYPNIENKMIKLGVRYKRVLPKDDDTQSPLGRSWKKTYNVTSKLELENNLNLIDGLTYSWNDKDEITIITQILPAIFYNTETDNYIFFNSLIAAYNGWQDSRNNRFESITYGNGEKIEKDVLEDITQFMEQNKVSWIWNDGDIIWIDNRQVLHSRNHFSGERKIYASLWGRPIKEYVQPKMIGCFNYNNIKLPLSFGLWKVSNATKVIYEAIKEGYRKFDCACDYGNEYEVGLGIKQALNEGICKREELFITSKLWNTYHNPIYVLSALKKTLTDLQLDYLDLYLIHFPISLEYIPFEKKYPPEWVNLDNKMVLCSQDLTETWKAMEELYNTKLVRYIGISNFNSSILRQIINTSSIKPHVIQLELHPYLSQPRMIKLCQDLKINIQAYSPLGAKSYIELNMANTLQDLTNNLLIIEISKKYNKTPVQILLRWAIQRKTTPICKASSNEHMRENLDIFDFSLSLVDMELINSLNKNIRFNDPGKFCLEAFGTFCPIYD